jgi:hypothetical protein
MYISSTVRFRFLAGLAIVITLTEMAQGNLVTNPGFESGDSSSWESFGQGWRIGIGADAQSGTYGVVNDVLSTDGDLWRGHFQNIPIIPDTYYSGGANIRAVSVGSSESWFELQFLDVNGAVIAQHQSAHVAGDQGFTFMGIGTVLAPAGAVTASVRVIVYMASPPLDADFHIFDGVVFEDVTPPHAILENWGFETGDLSGWNTFGQGWRIGIDDDAYSHSHGAVNDVLFGDVDSWRGIYQNVRVTPGLTYAAGIYIRAVGVESSSSWLEVQWLDNAGGVISQLTTSAVVADQPFTLASLHNIVAPVGAVTASVRGIVHMVSAPAVDGDFHNFDEGYFLRPVDVSITLSASTNPVAAHQEIVYALLISNRSTSMSGSYFVTNNLTTNLAFVSASHGGVVNGSVVSWSLFGLLGGATTTLIVTAVQPHFTGSTQEYTQVVSASVQSGIGDPIPGNNSVLINTITVGIPMLGALATAILVISILYAAYRRHHEWAGVSS